MNHKFTQGAGATVGDAQELEKAGDYAGAAVAYRRAGDSAGGHTHAANCYQHAERCEARAKARREEEPEEGTQLWPISYAYDVSKYADFCIRAETEEKAIAIAQHLLRNDPEFLPSLLDHRAREYDNGAANARVFEGEHECDEDDELTSIAEVEGWEMPEGWNVPKPAPPTAPSEEDKLRLRLADALAVLEKTAQSLVRPRGLIAEELASARKPEKKESLAARLRYFDALLSEAARVLGENSPTPSQHAK